MCQKRSILNHTYTETIIKAVEHKQCMPQVFLHDKVKNNIIAHQAMKREREFSTMLNINDQISNNQNLKNNLQLLFRLMPKESGDLLHCVGVVC